MTTAAAVVVVGPAEMVAALTATAVAGGQVKNKVAASKVAAVKRATIRDEYGQQQQRCHEKAHSFTAARYRHMT
jgi:hypothetical protein